MKLRRRPIIQARQARAPRTRQLRAGKKRLGLAGRGTVEIHRHPLTARSALIDEAGGVSYSRPRCLRPLGAPSHSQGMNHKSQFDRTPAMKRAVLLAVLMFVVFAIAEVVHFHPVTTPESHCSLCMAAHSAATPTQVSATPAPALVFAPAESSEPQLQSCLFVPVASIRPPPPAV
jgi:hypothetical protein